MKEVIFLLRYDSLAEKKLASFLTSFPNYTDKRNTDTALLHKLRKLKNQHGEYNGVFIPSTLSTFSPPHSTHKGQFLNDSAFYRASESVVAFS